MSEIKYEVGSGNVFADLGFEAPEEELARAELAHRIATVIEDRGLPQAEAATIMGIPAAEIAALIHGRLEGFSLGELARCLVALGHDVEIVVRPAAEGRLHVRAVG